MMKYYEFVCVDRDELSGPERRTVVSFETEEDSWGGFNEPMNNFMAFLKGCGYMFDNEATIGIQEGNGDFHFAIEYL